MSDQNDQYPSNSYPSHQRRRSSFVGQAFTDMFNRNSRPSEASGNSPPSHGPIAAAAAEASRRRLSVSTLGMGTSSPNQTNSPLAARMRGESVSSSSTTYNPNLHDSESAIDDDPSPSSATSFAAANHGHFARRVSFGARALQDIKGGASSSSSSSVPAGRPSATVAVAIPEEDVVVAAGEKKTLAPTSSSLGRREGFNWADNMRTRAERGSIASISASPPSNHSWIHSRSKSIAVMDTPVRDNPKPVNVPDQFQERILKGDFYMD